MTLQIALNLARNGYYVHPLAPKDKTPIAEHGSNDATRDEDTIRAWWVRWPAANVGISLDKTGLVDIAPDCAEWAEQFKANGMPRTMLYTSGGGAGHWHTLYRLSQGGPQARVCVTKQYDIMSQGNAVAPGSMHPSGKAYQLHTSLLSVEDLPLAPAWAIEILQAHVKGTVAPSDDADWQELPSGALLAQSRRFQALCTANDQLRTVCAGEAVTLTTKEGGKDSSTSIQRAVFVNQLLRAHYPYAEIRALAMHFSGVLERNPKWFTTDIDRLIDRYTPKNFKSEPTRGPLAPRGGRHYEITAGELLDRYHASADCGVRGIVLEWSIGDVAERLDVSTATIKRREAELIEAGHIQRAYGYVILSPDTWDIGSQPIKMRHAEDTTDEKVIGSQFDSPHQDVQETPESAVCEEPARDLEITHSPESAPTGHILCCGPWFYIADGARCGSTARTEASAWALWNGAAQTDAEQYFDDSDQPELATYTPVDLPDVPYTGSSRHSMSYEQLAKLAGEMMRPREQTDDTIDLLANNDPESDDEPLVRCAPDEPKAAREYYALKNKKAKSAQQAIWMLRQIAELEVLRPFSEVALGLAKRVLSRAVGPPALPHQPQQEIFM